MLGLLLFSPLTAKFFNFSQANFLIAGIAVYVASSSIQLLWQLNFKNRFLTQLVYLGFVTDIAAASFLLIGVGGTQQGMGLLMIIPLASAGILLPLRLALFYAALSALIVLAQAFLSVYQDTLSFNSLLSGGLHGIVYFGTVFFAVFLNRKASASLERAEQTEAELASQEHLNALILERMRSGIMVVDKLQNIRQINESAWYLMGMPNDRYSSLGKIAQPISERLEVWQHTHQHDTTPIQLSPGIPSIVPRFAELSGGGPSAILVFLEDTSMVSRRAEEMSLAAMGRMAAGIAHEIRNPLSAIQHAAQLLEEEDYITEADQALLQIITGQSQRVNAIIENVLQIARRSPSKPESLDLSHWLKHDYQLHLAHRQITQPYQLEITAHEDTPDVLFDPEQLKQILDNLFDNAIRYGANAHHEVIMTIETSLVSDEKGPFLTFCDQGNGVPPQNIQAVFEPFFTSSTRGTGLGLYLARQLSSANQAELSIIDSPKGACFRLGFMRARSEYNPIIDTATEQAPAISE